MKIGDKVKIKGSYLSGVIVSEDKNNNWSPRLPNEKLFNLKLSNTKFGGGWREGELELI